VKDGDGEGMLCEGVCPLLFCHLAFSGRELGAFIEGTPEQNEKVNHFIIHFKKEKRKT
jgi:hypothetical protein